MIRRAAAAVLAAAVLLLAGCSDIPTSGKVQVGPTQDVKNQDVVLVPYKPAAGCVADGHRAGLHHRRDRAAERLRRGARVPHPCAREALAAGRRGAHPRPGVAAEDELGHVDHRDGADHGAGERAGRLHELPDAEEQDGAVPARQGRWAVAHRRDARRHRARHELLRQPLLRAARLLLRSDLVPARAGPPLVPRVGHHREARRAGREERRAGAARRAVRADRAAGDRHRVRVGDERAIGAGVPGGRDSRSAHRESDAVARDAAPDAAAAHGFAAEPEGGAAGAGLGRRDAEARPAARPGCRAPTSAPSCCRAARSAT